MAGALGVAFVSGWARQELLTALTGPLVSLPWAALRRVVLGLALDLPPALAVVVLCAIAGRVLLFANTRRAAWIASASLTAGVWALDAGLAWLVLDVLDLWTDVLVLAGRAPMMALALVGGAYALGWRPGRRGDTGPGAAPEGEGARQNEFDGAGPPG
jgi:hypothetical protein